MNNDTLKELNRIKLKAEQDKVWWAEAQKNEASTMSDKQEEEILERMFLLHTIEELQQEVAKQTERLNYESELRSTWERQALDQGFLLKKAKQALEFYANKESYEQEFEDYNYTPVELDGGEIAKEELKRELLS